MTRCDGALMLKFTNTPQSVSLVRTEFGLVNGPDVGVKLC